MQFKLNNNMVIREEDRSIFDATRFAIYKFNQKGFSLLMRLQSGKATEQEYTEFMAFIDKCKSHGICL